ncbi:MAG: SEC-C domain-containing protein [Candidatus Dormibacteria bacterium]
MTTGVVFTGRPGRNAPCWCGSGLKYKVCHADRDRVADRQAAAAADAQAQEAYEASHDHGEGRLCEDYRPTSRAAAAVTRPEFLGLVKRMRSRGATVLHIGHREDLARNEAGFRQALDFLQRNEIRPHFVHDDPPPEAIDGAQALLDHLFGVGTYRIRPSAESFRRQYRLWQRDTDGALLTYWLGRPLEVTLAHVLVHAAQDDLDRQGFGGVEPLQSSAGAARLLRDLPRQREQLPERFREIVGSLMFNVLVATTESWPDTSRWPPSTGGCAVPAGLAWPGALDAPDALGERPGIDPSEVARLAELLATAVAADPEAVRIVGLAAPDVLDDPAGFQAWAARLETAGLSPSGSAGEAAERALDNSVASTEAGEPAGDWTAAGAATATALRAATLPVPSAGADQHPLFTELGRPGEGASRLQEIKHLTDGLVSKQAGREEERLRLDAQRAELDRQDADAITLMANLEGEAEQIRAGHHRDRRDKLIGILAIGAQALDAADAAWVEAQAAQPRDADPQAASKHRQTLSDYERMQARGELGIIPESLRAILESHVAEARAALATLPDSAVRATLPLAVNVDTRGGETIIRVLVPLEADRGDRLTPGTLAAAVARGVAEGVHDTAEILETGPLHDIASEPAGPTSLLEAVGSLPKSGLSDEEATGLAAESLREALNRSTGLGVGQLIWDVYPTVADLLDAEEVGTR